MPFDGKSKNYTYNDQPQQLGLLEGHKVVEIMKGNLVEVTGPISSSFEVLPLPLNKLYTYEEAKKMLGNAPRDVGYDHDVYRGTNWLRALLRHYEQALPFPTKTTDLYFHPQGFVLEKPIEDLEVQCQIEQVLVARIGSMPLVALQGEVTAPIGARIKDNFRRRMPIMLFAYMGEHECYIPTREIVRQNVYQALVIRTLYASPVGWAPEVEDAMVAGVNKMVDNVMGNASK